MTRQLMADASRQYRGDVHGITAPDAALPVVGAMLALGIAAVHVADQGGVTALDSPAWMGWGFRLIEVGGTATALILLLSPLAPPALAWAGWAAGAVLGAGPFAGYLLSRTVGVPGDPRDVGNWGYWVGTVSLFIEAALVVLSVSMLLAHRRSGVRGGSGGDRGGQAGH
jgi:hypothetical protein